MPAVPGLLYRTDRRVELADLAVAADLQRRGIGRRLV
jgi:ribosomal protein S18 acetylase RimI-like enzyme